jgi:hydrogenase expression/formation protein HypE
MLLSRFGHTIKFLRDPTRGGVASVLNEIASQSGHGFLVRQSQLPLDEQVEGACEMLGLEPLYVANEGIFLTIVENNIAAEAVALLRHHPLGQNAAIIGEVTDDPKGKVVLKNPAGGRRIIGFLPGEQLPRIC